MPFEKGNKAAAKARKFYNMLNVALGGDDLTKLRNIADKLVAAAEAGEQWAIREIADRLDGKPAQAITGEDGGPLEIDMTHKFTGVPRPDDFKDPAVVKAIVDAMNASKA